MPPAAAFSHTKCADPTITPTGTICMVFVCLTTRMNPSTQSAHHEDLWALLELLPRNLELEDVIPSAESSCTSWKRSILLCRRAGAPEIGGSDWVESSWSIIQEKREFVLRRCYRSHSLHFAYTGPRCYELQAWSLGWHWYILPCNQVPDAQQM